jgi:hypothetical protein
MTLKEKMKLNAKRYVDKANEKKAKKEKNNKK